jgi:hypothetical protein
MLARDEQERQLALPLRCRESSSRRTAWPEPLRGCNETSSETRVVSPLPSVAHRLTVKNEENRGDEDENSLIDRPWDRQEPKSGDPPQRLWNPIITGQELHCPDRSGDECACGSHATSLGRTTAGADSRCSSARRMKVKRSLDASPPICESSSGCCDHRAMSTDEDLHRHAAENLALADALLFGRVTYEMMEAA